MHLTISRSHRNVRDSIKREFVRVPRYDSVLSPDSDCSSIAGDKSDETNSSKFPKLSKRQKFKSFFSHSKSKQNSFSSDSSNSTNEDIASIQSISSQSQKLSKREKVRSFFSHSKSKQVTFSSDASYSTNEDIASIQSISSQCQKLSKREKFKSYFKHSSPYQRSLSDSSTVIDEKLPKQPKSSKTQNIKSLFGLRQPSTKVFITPSPKIETDPTAKKIYRFTVDNTYSSSESLGSQHLMKLANRQILKRKLYKVCKLTSVASNSVAAITIVSSTTLAPVILPIVVPIAVVFTAIILFNRFKLLKEQSDYAKKKVSNAKYDASRAFRGLKLSFRGRLPSRPYNMTPHVPKRKVFGKPENSIHTQSKTGGSVEECRSIRESDCTDDDDYSIYSGSIHSANEFPSCSLFDLLGGGNKKVRKVPNVTFADPIASVRMYMPSVLIC